jgi:hypothetical protein
MAQYTITLTDAEDKALKYVAFDAQEWIENVTKNRCRQAIDEIVDIEIKTKLDAGESISGSRDEIVLASTLKSAAERDAEQTQIG